MFKLIPRNRKRILMFCILVSLLFFWAPFKYKVRSNGNSNNISQYVKGRQRKVREEDTYQLVQQNCSIPLVHRFSYAYNSSNLDKRLNPLIDACESVPDFSRVENQRLILTDPRLNVSDCCMREIQRPQQHPKDSFKFVQSKNDCRVFDPVSRSIDVRDVEFMQVICKSSAGFVKAKYNFHSNVPVNEKESVKKKRDFWAVRREKKRQRPMGVFLLVLDSTSRTEMYRNLRRTTELLTDKMGFVDFKGHHPQGETSLVNALAILLGLSHKDFWKKFKFFPDTFWDNAPFIWSTFNRLNYITGFCEDLPFHSTFNFNHKGFLHQPTDFYTRPVMLAHNLIFPFDRQRICFGNRTVLQFLLDHQYEIFQNFQDAPTFMVMWSAWPQHEIPTSLQLHDKALYNFFSKLNNLKGFLDNNLLILTSGHGFTKYTYAKTHEGLLERRNLPLFIRLPERLIRIKNNTGGMDLVDNLLQNSEGVTSHFDVHKTMLKVAEMGKEWGMTEAERVTIARSNYYGKNLLDLVSENEGRSCADAHIPQTMCSCNLEEPQDSPDEMLGNTTLSGGKLAFNESEWVMKFN